MKIHIWFSQKYNDDKEFWCNYLKNLSFKNSYVPMIYKIFQKGSSDSQRYDRIHTSFLQSKQNT